MIKEGGKREIFGSFSENVNIYIYASGFYFECER